MRKKATLCILSIFVFVSVASAQYGTFSKEELELYTAAFAGERFDNGRPRVPDIILERMKDVSIEEAWGVLRKHGYHNQFAGDWINIHPDRIFVGRAVTAAFVPKRPDLDTVTNELGKKNGTIGAQNSWIIDTLVENDVIVVDLFGKVKNGTFAGDNLATSIATRSKTGMIIDGGVRDLDGIYAIPDFNAFVRGIDPTEIREVTLLGINRPIMIGEATVLPGDVVLARREGVIFIPPQLAEEVCTTSENVRLRDQFGHQRLREGKYTPGEIDRKWTDNIEADFQEWMKTQDQ
jgi:4-hydroxy-4-methyl-2-oxoglutarate aldolase